MSISWKTQLFILWIGILMCFAWIIFLSTGIIFGRYMRDHWPNSRIFGLMLWYHVNFYIILAAQFYTTNNVPLTIAGFVCVFTANDWLWLGPSTDQNSNKYRLKEMKITVGLLSCLLAWTQPLIAIFRCKPQLKLRSIFNVIHRTVGVVSWILAATAITIAVRWFKQCFRSPVAALATFIVFLAVFGVTIIVNEVSLRYIRANRSLSKNES
uniref:ascorbate ferrireductase (transmembrane) n=1 Tax=Syphacia muris TaxID=451379 RepID=A0A0N5ATC6_9BILA